MSHTPTPWAWHWRKDDKEAPGSVHATGPEGRAPAIAMCPRYGKDAFKHDAPRIVACVNAFHGAGIPTEKIEPGMVVEMMRLLCEFANDVTCMEHKRLPDWAWLATGNQSDGTTMEQVECLLAGLKP